jgi:hypothetical protein
VYSWGQNHHGQLGLAGCAQQALPTLIPGLADVTQIAAGWWHSVCVSGDPVFIDMGPNLGTTPTVLSTMPNAGALWNRRVSDEVTLAAALDTDAATAASSSHVRHASGGDYTGEPHADGDGMPRECHARARARARAD